MTMTKKKILTKKKMIVKTMRTIAKKKMRTKIH